MTITSSSTRLPQWTFAERTRKVRRDMHLTQQAMAEALGVGLKRYSAWEAGTNAPEDMVAIAVELERVSGVPRAWFLGWLDAEPRSQDYVGAVPALAPFAPKTRPRNRTDARRPGGPAPRRHCSKTTTSRGNR